MLRFRPGDIALLLYTRTIHEVAPTAGTIVHVHRIRIVDDPWDELPCHYVVGDRPLTSAGMVQGHERWVLDCQLAPLKGEEADEDEDVEIESENEV